MLPHAPDRRIPIIALTVRALHDEQYNGYLAKPIKIESLVCRDAAVPSVSPSATRC